MLLLIGCHVKVLPFNIVAVNICPKLSKAQSAGCNLIVEDNEAEPHPVKYSTPAKVAWADRVPATALVIPVRSLVEIPV